MSTLLDTLLDPARRAECARHDAPPCPGACTPAPLPGAELRRLIAGQPHVWPQVPFRTAGDGPRRRRADPPRPSRHGDLTP